MFKQTHQVVSDEQIYSDISRHSARIVGAVDGHGVSEVVVAIRGIGGDREVRLCLAERV